MRNIEIITASAGTGKTTRLARLLDEAIGASTARPEGIIATTFTRQAAAELQNRARTRLLEGGRGQEAHALLAARIGTVNSVCGGLVSDFTFELGISPELRVLDENAAELELKRALASVVDDEESDILGAFKGKFDQDFDWQYEVRRIIEAARSNRVSPAGLAECARESTESLDACLGEAAADGRPLDDALAESITTALAALEAAADGLKNTADYCERLKSAARDLRAGRLAWGDWALLITKEPSKKLLAHIEPVRDAAARHIAHPRLRVEMKDLIGRLFDVAARGLLAYQARKTEHGLMDYVDQEVLALDLLAREEVRDALSGQIDLVLVDEFQDTSPLQLAIFLQLATIAKRSVWVGDPKQAIFGFRGTDPALMDAAIESLSSPSHDPDLVSAAVDAVSAAAPSEILSRSYRSRKSLVDVTNAVFARAFSIQQGMPEDRVRVEAERPESAAPGLAYHQWPLVPSRSNATTLSESVAAGIRDLLGSNMMVGDRATGADRVATAADVAILCRTNAQCDAVAAALHGVGVPAVLAQVGLMSTAEAQVLLAGLHLWVDPRDSLAIATLARILEHPQDAAAFISAMTEGQAERKGEAAAAVGAAEGEGEGTSSRERGLHYPWVDAVDRARVEHVDADVLAVIDALLVALDLRELCAAWGDSPQRIANLDALRAHASAYCNQRRAVRDVPSLVGLIDALTEFATESRFGGKRTDTCARVGGDRAVTVSTWHASKGLEWPIVVLFGLENNRDPQAYGVHVMTDRETFDVDDPLGGRRIHFWPNPYRTGNTRGPVKDAYAASAAHRFVADRAERESLRVLYVGWTRARDRLILAAGKGKLLGGLLGTLESIEPGMLKEAPPKESPSVEMIWGGLGFPIAVSPKSPTEPEAPQRTPGTVRIGRGPTGFPPARRSPSSAPPRPCTLGDPIRLGAAAITVATADVDRLGNAVHAFLAADDTARDPTARSQMAEGLLARHEVADVIDPAQLLAASDALMRWIKVTFPGAPVRREWPMGYRDDHGTRVTGTADLIVEAKDQFAIVDHKSYRSADAARSHAADLGGQLACYREAIEKACADIAPGKTVSTWIHLPLAGVVVPLVHSDSAGS